MRDSPFPSPLKLCFRYEYEYESHLPLIRSPRATIPSISIKMGRCLGSIMRARHFSRFPSSSSRPRAEEGGEGGEGGGKKNRASVWKKKKGGERSETRKTLSPWGKFAERPVSGFFRPLSAWQIVSKTVAGTWATSPPRLRRPRFLNAFQNLDDLSVPVLY